MILDGVEIPTLLTIEQAIAVLKTDMATHQGWIDTGKVETVHANGRIHVLMSSIENRMGHKTLSRTNHDAQL